MRDPRESGIRRRAGSAGERDPQESGIRRRAGSAGERDPQESAKTLARSAGLGPSLVRKRSADVGITSMPNTQDGLPSKDFLWTLSREVTQPASLGLALSPGPIG